MATEPTPTDAAMEPCGDCGMPCAQGEYHPYAACLMFKACHNSETVRANLNAVRAQPAPAASQKPLTDGQRLAFLCSTEKPRRIEHQKGLWRVYQDEAPAESEHADWRALTYLFYATPEQAIDEAACCITKGA